MTIRTREFTSWQSPESTPKLTKYRTVSPNVLQILSHITATFPGTKSLGNYQLRTIRGGDAWSTHAYGAAQDVSFRDVGNMAQAKRDVIRLLVENSLELGVQAVHDYSGPGISGRGGRGFIWRCNRSDIGEASIGWKKQKESPNGMGQSWADWIHFEVCEAAWFDNRSVADRLSGAPPLDTSTFPPFDPAQGHWSLWPLAQNKPVLVVGTDHFDSTRYAQGVLNTTGAALLVDGDYGPRTEQAVIQFQQPRGLDTHGRVEERTWAQIDEIAGAPPAQPAAPPPPVEAEVPATAFDPENERFGTWPERDDKPELREGSVASDDEREATRYLTGVAASIGYVLDVGDRFDSRTTAVVKKIQRSNQLEPTGVVGPETWKFIDIYADD